MKENKQSWIRQHYHWVVFVTVFLGYMLFTSVNNNCYTLFLIPITKELGIPRSAFALYSTFSCIPGCFSNLLFPRFYKRLGYRKTVAVLMLCYAFMMLCYSRAQGVTPFYVGASTFALVASFVGTAGVSRIITDWFHKRRGLLLGIILASSGVGSSLGSVVLTAILEASTWRTAYIAASGIVLLGGLLVFLLVRNTPEEMGLKPFGDEENAQETEVQTRKESAKEWEGVPLSILKKRPHFYIMLAAILLSNLAAYVIYPTLVSHMQDLGMPLSKAAQIQSFMFLFLAAAKIFEGSLSDRFGAKKIMVLCLVCCAVSATILAKGASYGVTVIGLIIFSFALAESTVMLPILAEGVYGFYDRSAILGRFLAVTRLAIGFGPTLANIAYDALGSYTPIYYIMAVVAVGTLVLFAVAVRGADREKELVMQEEARILNP